MSRTRALRASIWAQDVNGVIGDGHQMLWHVPADFAFFKTQTMGCPLIMGRASFEALGRPLPGRTNIVLSRNRDYSPAGAVVAHTLEEAFALAEEDALSRDAAFIWVSGGAHVYKETMGMVDRLYVTQLELEVSPEPGIPLVQAPAVDPAKWRVLDADALWREKSGDSRWKVTVYEARK